MKKILAVLAMVLLAVGSEAADRRFFSMWSTNLTSAIPSAVSSGWQLTPAFSIGDGTAALATNIYNRYLDTASNAVVEWRSWPGYFTSDGTLVPLYVTLKGWMMTNANPYGTNMTLTFGDTDVDTDADIIAIPVGDIPWAWSTGTRFRLTTTDTLPAPLGAGTNYYLIRHGSTTNYFYAASSFANALASNVINLTSAGAGTQTLSVPTNGLTLTATNFVSFEQSYNRTNWFTLTNMSIELTGSAFPPTNSTLPFSYGQLSAPYFRIHSVTNRFVAESTNANHPMWLWLEGNVIAP